MPGAIPNARRDLFRSSIEVLVLAVLADGPAHGYAIRQQLKYTLGQTLPVGSLYPLLHRLEAESWIHATQAIHRGRPRKTYRLTDEGERHLKHAAADWQANIAQLQSLVLPAVRRAASRSKAKAT
jgi:DNA-binding PadR family transcriptional regulator